MPGNLPTFTDPFPKIEKRTEFIQSDISFVFSRSISFLIIALRIFKTRAMNAMSFHHGIINISDSEEEPMWQEIPRHAPTPDNPEPVRGRPMTFEPTWDSDNDSVRFESSGENSATTPFTTNINHADPLLPNTGIENMETTASPLTEQVRTADTNGPLNDLEEPTPGPSSAGQYLPRNRCQSDSSSSWFYSEAELDDYSQYATPSIQLMTTMVEEQMAVTTSTTRRPRPYSSYVYRPGESHWTDSSSEQPSDSEHNPCQETVPAVVQLTSPPPIPCLRIGHVFAGPDETPKEFRRPDQYIPESPMSPPDHERGPTQRLNNDIEPTQDEIDDTLDDEVFVVEPSPIPEETTPYQYPALLDPEIDNTGDCIICGQSYREVLNAAATDYLVRTNYMGEPIEQRIAKREAFLQGLKSKAAITIKRGLSQVATCDGNMYDVYCGTIPKLRSGPVDSLPLLE